MLRRKELRARSVFYRRAPRLSERRDDAGNGRSLADPEEQRPLQQFVMARFSMDPRGCELLRHVDPKVRDLQAYRGIAVAKLRDLLRQPPLEAIGSRSQLLPLLAIGHATLHHDAV